MTLTPNQNPTSERTTLEPNTEPMAREKSTTAARVAISNGPAAGAVEARKEKKKKEKKNKSALQGDGPRAMPEAENGMPPPPPPPPIDTQLPSPSQTVQKRHQRRRVSPSPPTAIHPDDAGNPHDPEHTPYDSDWTRGTLPSVRPGRDPPTHDATPPPERENALPSYLPDDVPEDHHEYPSTVV
ncbi:hypothetical protein EDB85DRAFT_2148584 [Lactarius pseudohatsudake]|nr:hypothetical protein EDB85DRAFT_2148584 [Lactarius pseudohatsudake]